jgi:hypothetical protein
MGHTENPIRWRRDVTPADWWTARLAPSYDCLSALMPDGYEAHVRVFHPARIGANGPAVTWAALARQNGRIVHSEMRFSAISRLPGHTVADDVVAPAGTLPLREARRLVELLGRETTTPNLCWFCRWADDDRGVNVDDQGVTEQVILPSGGKGYLLHAGPIELALVSPRLRDEMDGEYVALRLDLTPREMEEELAAWRADRNSEPGQPPPALLEETLYRAPILWWPDDRSWFVATETELATTYVGGTRKLIDQLMVDPQLEALEAEVTNSLSEFDDWPNAELDRRAQTW